MKSYEDNVVLSGMKYRKSLQSVIVHLEEFGFFSGYKINSNKTIF